MAEDLEILKFVNSNSVKCRYVDRVLLVLLVPTAPDTSIDLGTWDGTHVMAPTIH